MDLGVGGETERDWYNWKGSSTGSNSAESTRREQDKLGDATACVEVCSVLVMRGWLALADV